MPKRFYDRPYPSRFTPLVTYLAARDDAMVTLNFAQIEAIIGIPLSMSAQVGSAYWCDVAGSRVARDLRAIGWRARLNARTHTVEFRHVPSTSEEADV